MRTTPRVILILKQASSATRLHKTLAPKLVLTWWQEFKERIVMAVTWWQQFKERFPTAPLEFPQENKRRRVPQVSHNFAVRTPLRQLKQTRFCWPFNNWRQTVIQPISTTTSVDSRICLNSSKRQRPHLIENQRNLNCLKIYSKQKIHNQLTEAKIYYFHSLMLGDALQTFKNIGSPNRENLTEILTVFRRKYVKPQSMATARHKFQQLVFNPANQKLFDFLDDLQKLAKNAFGVAAQAIIDQFIYAKMPPHLKKSINQAHLENGTYEQIVTHLERELELNSLEYSDEIQMNTVTHKQQIEGNPGNPGVVPECPGSSGFIRKSSSCASAPRMRFCVLLNSFDSLFVTRPSISSETWVI